MISTEPADYHVNNSKRLTEQQSGNKRLHSYEIITHGVPQGLIMALALCNLYPQSRKVAHWNHLLLTLSYIFRFLSKMLPQVCSRLMKAWLKPLSGVSYNNYCLLINADKTKLLVMGNCQVLQRLPKDFHVTLPGKELSPTQGEILACKCIQC